MFISGMILGATSVLLVMSCVMLSDAHRAARYKSALERVCDALVELDQEMESVHDTSRSDYNPARLMLTDIITVCEYLIETGGMKS